MIDLSYSIEERKDFSLPGPSAPKYPHGLRITLNDETLKKLGISEMPEIGKEFKAEISMTAIEISEEDQDGDVKKHRLELQIKEMVIKKDKEDGMSTTSVMYGV